jgi:hypothetical protein
MVFAGTAGLAPVLFCCIDEGIVLIAAGLVVSAAGATGATLEELSCGSSSFLQEISIKETNKKRLKMDLVLI